MAKKTLYFDNECGVECYALAEDGKVCECTFEPEHRGTAVGNIYKGRVTDVLNGMQAAFVNCGLERNCYLSVEDLLPDRSKYDGLDIDIPKVLNLHVGDEIMVQVTKTPINKKGAKVTTNISLVGKYIIYMPVTPFIGISRKITDEELRKTMLLHATNAVRGSEGLVVRTAAPYALYKTKLDELDFYRKVFNDIKTSFEKAKVGELLYSDMPLHVRAMRDVDIDEVEQIHCGTKTITDQISAFLKVIPPHGELPVVRHAENSDMFFSVGLSDQLISIMQPRVELENGADIVIERTEALTVIDVNTGKYIGTDSLEQTVYYTNMLAAREIARQVRLRNIGGIIVVDFIDMEDVNHQNAIVEELEKALADDKAKCHVLPMSELGLVEFTRKRIGPSPLTMMTKPCKSCRSSGYIRSSEFILFDLRAKLLDLLSNGNKQVYITMNSELAGKLFDWTEMVDSIKNAHPEAKVYIVPHRHYHEDMLAFTTAAPSILSPDTKLLY
jgi:ribonuclease G